jgi:hypothetical protein
MSLREIQNNLYKKDAPDDLEKHGTSEFSPEVAKDALVPEAPENDLWKEKKTEIGKDEKKILKRGLIAFASVLFLVLLLAVGFRVKYWLFDQGRASVSISGPEQAKSGRLLTYEIIYKNDNLVDMNNAEVRISYPENLKPDENLNFKEESLTSGSFYVGNIKSKSEGRVVFNAKAYSPKGALIYLKADLIYQPSNFSSRFETKAQLGVNVISSPIVLEIQAPQNVASGDAIDYLISYRNESAENFPSFKIKIDYPEGFSFSRASINPSEGNNVFYVSSMSPGQSDKIVVSGKLSGEQGKNKIVKVYAGVTQGDSFVSLNEESADTKLASSAFFIAQKVNDLENLSVNPGDTLQFRILYKNNSAIGLRDVIITEKLDSPVLNYATLDIPGGRFDFESKTITWKSSDIPKLRNLAPGDGGEVPFSIRVKEIIPMENENDKNYVIKSLAKIDSPDVPTPISMNKIIASNEMDIKLNTKLILDVKGFYNDPVIANTGPVPPQVDQETTYTIHWKIINVSNDVSGAKVTANLPTIASATGKISPENARITYDERNNSITWEIGNVKAGTGIINSPLEARFQVKIKPYVSQVGQEVKILEESSLLAKDVFTGETLQKKADGKNTNLIEDGSLEGEGRVVQ